MLQRKFLIICIYISLSSLLNAQDFKIFIQNIVPLRADGKIAIPSNIKHIKLDIGLSYSAPMSQYWLMHEDDLWVFGFEPNPESVQSVLRGAPQRGDWPLAVEKKFIGTQFFLIPCALGEHRCDSVDFYVTANDCGCSSLYKPVYLPIQKIITVPVFPLTDFFELFPFDTHPIIEYIKIDAQGSDLDIIKSGGKYIQQHVVYVTLEPENVQYEGTTNAHADIEQYMCSIGFMPYQSPHTTDPTYLNNRYSAYAHEHNIKIFQQY